MNGKYNFYKTIYIKEEQRQELKLKYNDRKMYLYIDKTNHLIISRNRIPRNFKYRIIRAEIGNYLWKVHIPLTFLPDNKWYDRYALIPITEDKMTCQISKISSRIFIKENNCVRITPLSKTRRAKIEKLRLHSNPEPTTNGKDANIFNTLS